MTLDAVEVGGCFAAFAPRYADLGLAVFPVEAKRPLVRNWRQIGCRASRRFALRDAFAKAGLGVCCGRRSGLTVVDVDAPGDRPLNDALARFGDTPLIARTATGKHHLYFRHNGERRRIRYDGLDVDILGEGGFCILPPSAGNGGQYEFVRGDFDDLRVRLDLPVARIESTARQRLERERDELHVEIDFESQHEEPIESDIGRRDEDLFARCRTFAASANSVEEVEQFAMMENQIFRPPLSDAQARLKARQAWKYKSEGRLFVPGCEPSIVSSRSHITTLIDAPLAFTLLSLIRVHHEGAPHKEFALAIKPLKKMMRVGAHALNEAIETLIDRGHVERKHKGGTKKGDPSRYRLTVTAER